MLSKKMVSCYLLLLLCVVQFTVSEPRVPAKTCAVGKYSSNSKSRVTETYVLNLDLPPKERWTQLAKSKSSQIQQLLDTFKPVLLKRCELCNRTDYLELIFRTIPLPLADEMRGVSEAVGLSKEDVLLVNLFYELEPQCTSIIAEDSSGSLFHVRNLDFGVPFWDGLTEKLRSLVVNIDWQRNDTTVFKSVNFAGYIGILTAIKPKQFTLTVNTRKSTQSKDIKKEIGEIIFANKSKSWVGFLTRSVLENAISFSQAKSTLEDAVLLAPVYFILGGNKSREGVVISRNETQPVDTWGLKDASRFYILMTNTDRSFIMQDERTLVAYICLDKMEPNRAGFPEFFNVLSTRPVLNSWTTYTALMRVDTGELETYIQNCCKNASIRTQVVLEYIFCLLLLTLVLSS